MIEQRIELEIEIQIVSCGTTQCASLVLENVSVGSVRHGAAGKEQADGAAGIESSSTGVSSAPSSRSHLEVGCVSLWGVLL